MDISLKKTDKYVDVVISGSLDAVTSPQAEAKLMPEVNSATNMIIDFAAVSYISSAGLRVMLGIAKGMQAKGGQLILCTLPQQVRDVFDISGFTSIFKIVATKAEATSLV